jgi:four helix bundle suffix protein
MYPTETFKNAIEHEEPDICANTMITLIRITTWLLNQQIKSLEATFLKKGGLCKRIKCTNSNKKEKFIIIPAT